jgi:hypothetical protein
MAWDKGVTSMAENRTPTELSTIPPLPFWPNLKWKLRSHGAALLLIYLEVHFPAQQDSSDTPVLVDVDRTLVDLCLSPRALWKFSAMIAVRWPSPRRLRVARQAGREFFTRLSMGAGSLKPYSYVPISRHQWELRRNTPRLKQLLTDCNMPYPLLAQGILVNENATIRGFHSSSSDFPIESGQALARDVAGGLAVAVDGRRATGLKRRWSARAKWTEERRARFMATVTAKYAKMRENTAKHLSDGSNGRELSDM